MCNNLLIPADDPQLAVILNATQKAPKELKGLSEQSPPLVRNLKLTGCGSGRTIEEARIPALAEMMERYSAATFRHEEFITATANDLASDALDLNTLPICSRDELDHPKCPLVKPDKNKPIRWVRGIRLRDQRVVYLPAVMVYTYLDTWHDERFWFQNTSGCAAHVSYERAITAGIYELLERDAISIVWLQRLQLPRILVDNLGPTADIYWRRYQNSSRHLEYAFYDATNDLGVPIVYGLRLSSVDARVATIVACAASERVEDSFVKVLRDLTVFRQAFRTHRDCPDDWYDFKSVYHGATYMARAEV